MGKTTIKRDISIVEQGTSGTSPVWAYRKWSDGTAECWCKANITRSFTAWGNIYYAYGADPSWSYPTELFNEPPVCNVNTEGGPGHFVILYNNNSKSNTPKVSIGSGVNPGTESFTVYIHAIGTWK